MYEISAVVDQWQSPEAMFFKVRCEDGNIYVLHYDEHECEWTLLTRPLRLDRDLIAAVQIHIVLDNATLNLLVRKDQQCRGIQVQLLLKVGQWAAQYSEAGMYESRLMV